MSVTRYKPESNPDVPLVEQQINRNISSDPRANGEIQFGTVVMSEDAAEAELHGQHKLFIPKPSDDPNDPLV